MSDEVEPVLVQMPVLPRRLPEIDAFQRTEGLASRTEALALLLEIALDTITSTGRRFWDRPSKPVAARGAPGVFEPVYRSSNGDTWQLGRDTVSGAAIVRHEPNPASGGAISEVDLDTFLNRAGTGPEFMALRAMLTRAKTDI